MKLLDLIDTEAREDLEEVYDKLVERQIPEGFSLQQLEELEERKKEKLHDLYVLPLAQFRAKDGKVIPKNSLGKWISSLLASANGDASSVWRKAVAVASLAPGQVDYSTSPPQGEVKVSLKPGRKSTAPAVLARLRNLPVRRAARIAAFLGIRIEYERGLENVLLGSLCKFSNGASYPRNFISSAIRDKASHDTYGKILTWYSGLSEEDRQFFLSSYIRLDGVTARVSPSDLTFEKPTDRLSKRLEGLKYWKRDGKVIFDEQVWHVPVKEATSLLTKTIKYSPKRFIEERKGVLKRTIEKAFVPVKDIPQRLLFYGFFIRVGKKIIPAGIFTREFNKELLYRNREVKGALQDKAETVRERYQQRQKEFATYYSRARELLLKKDWTSFWTVAKKTGNRLERMAYYKARKDLKVMAKETENEAAG